MRVAFCTFPVTNRQTMQLPCDHVPVGPSSSVCEPARLKYHRAYKESMCDYGVLLQRVAVLAASCRRTEAARLEAERTGESRLGAESSGQSHPTQSHPA
jgi:hypothetical protein